MWRFLPDDSVWPPVPKLGILTYVKLGTCADSAAFHPGLSPADALLAARGISHPYSRAPPLDPTLLRTLSIARLPAAAVQRARAAQLAMWSNIADACDLLREDWLCGLPGHVSAMYRESKFNGPLFGQIHSYLVALGYPDVSLFEDICTGMPTGGALRPSGLWAPLPASKKGGPRPTVQSAMLAAADNVRRWQSSRRVDPCQRSSGP